MNDKHYPAGSKKGGQFAPKNASEVGNNAENSEKSLSFVPKKTLNGQKRTFYIDKTPDEQADLVEKYVGNNKRYFNASDLLKDEVQTHKIDTPQRELARMQWLEEEKKRQDKLGPKRKERKVTLILGLPGSGKSTFTKPLMQNQGAYVIDADNFVDYIPEYRKDPLMLQAVHKEGLDLSARFMDKLSNDGYNMVINKVGGSYRGIDRILDTLKKKGYRANVILNDVPFEECINRSIKRYENKETDRLVPLIVYIESDKHIFETFDRALNHPIVTNGRVYSNDVPEKSKPILLKEYQK